MGNIEMPIAVIVNQYSASAAEIVAACLQDNNVRLSLASGRLAKGPCSNCCRLEMGCLN